MNLPANPALLSRHDVWAYLSLAQACDQYAGPGSVLEDAGLRERFCALLEVDFVSVVLWDGLPQGRSQVFQHGRSSSLASDYERVRAQHSALDQAMSEAARLREGAAHARSLLPAGQFERTDYFNEILRPHQMEDLAGLYLRSAGVVLGNVSVARARSSRPLGERTLALLDLLAPKLACGFVQSAAGLDAPGQARAQTTSAPEAPPLTTREQQVCALVVKGMTDLEMAALLGIRYPTIRTYLQSIFLKLEVSNRVELAVRLSRHC